jgi:osmotically-inducible protein OsmY
MAVKAHASNRHVHLLAHGNLITSRLDKQHISYTAKNRVLTLTGKVRTVGERHQAEQLAIATPHVQQVLSQIDVNR